MPSDYYPQKNQSVKQDNWLHCSDRMADHHTRILQLKKIAAERNTRYLVHFTPIENLSSIMTYGLRSRQWLEAMGLEYRYTDDMRLDGMLDWISTSVSFPNETMFYKKRCSMAASVANWAVVVIRIEALWELNCKFIPTNAASIPKQQLEKPGYSSPEMFASFFDDPDKSGLAKLCYTRDVQAEVLIQGEIPNNYLVRVDTDSNQLARQLHLAYPGLAVHCHKAFYQKRRDY